MRRPSSSGSADGFVESTGSDASHHPADAHVATFASSGVVDYLNPMDATATTSHSVELIGTPSVGTIDPPAASTVNSLPSASELFEQPEPGSAADWDSIESNIQCSDVQQVKKDVETLVKGQTKDAKLISGIIGPTKTDERLTSIYTAIGKQVVETQAIRKQQMKQQNRM